MRLLSFPLIACLCLTLAACDSVGKAGGSGNGPPPLPFPSATPAPTESRDRDPLVRSILSQNDAVKAMLTGRQEGRDYWLRIDYVDRHREAPTTGDKPIAMVTIYLDPPVSYSGNVPTESDPCHGHYNDDDLDPNDPCLEQTPQYSTGQTDFLNAQVVTADVDLLQRKVVEVLGGGHYTADELKDVQSLYGQ